MQHDAETLSMVAEMLQADMVAIQGEPDPTEFLWESLGQCDDKNFDYAIEQAEKHGQLHGLVDFEGITAGVGVNEFGYVTLYLENPLKHGTHLTFSTPFTLDEWKAKQEGGK